MTGTDTGLIRSRLKIETQPFHARLEFEVGLAAPSLTISRYRDLLTRFLGFYIPWEEKIYRQPPPLLDQFLVGRRKVPWLKQDLAYFGIDPERQAQCSFVPSCAGFASALGSLYVIEGSTLGGQWTFRHLNSTLGISQDAGGRFFYGYGPLTSAKWKQFEELLSQCGQTEDADEIVRAAADTFEAMSEWLRCAS